MDNAKKKKLLTLGCMITAIIVVVFILILSNRLSTDGKSKFKPASKMADDTHLNLSQQGYDAGHVTLPAQNETRTESDSKLLSKSLSQSMNYPTEEAVSKGLVYPPTFTPSIENLYKPYNNKNDRYGPINNTETLPTEVRNKLMALDDSIFGSQKSWISDPAFKVTSGAGTSNMSERSHLEIAEETVGLVRIPVATKIAHYGTSLATQSPSIAVESTSNGSSYTVGSNQ